MCRKRWIDAARAAADGLLDHFWHPEQGGVFTTADDAEPLIVRQKDLLDNATPSANSTAAVALARLAALTGEMRYAHQGGMNPPIVIIHGSALDSIPDSYKRYLERYFMDAFKLQGTPLRIQFKASSNPFSERDK